MILVTGATGNIGRELIRLLLAQKQSVRALTREPARANLPAQVDVRAADLSDPATLAGAFDGIERALLLTHIPGDPAQADHALAAAKSAGVRHIVVISSMSTEALIPGDAIGEGHRLLEQKVGDSAIPATLLRPGTFTSNALFWAEQVRAGNIVRGMDFPPAALIDPWDIAAIAALALTTPGHEGKTYGLTGGERLSSSDQIAILAQVLDKPLSFEPLPLEALRQFVSHNGAGLGDPDAIIKALTNPNVPWAQPRPIARDLLGREPRSFRQWAQAHASAFR